MPLAVRVQRVAAGGERRLQADRGQRVLQRAPRAGVHVNVARGRQRQAAGARQRSEAFEPRTVAGAREQSDADPRPPGEHVGEPARRLVRRVRGAEPQREAARRQRRNVVARQRVAALGRIAPAARDQLRKVAVARAVGGIERERGAVIERRARCR